jgi:hypothetical protein
VVTPVLLEDLPKTAFSDSVAAERIVAPADNPAI